MTRGQKKRYGSLPTPERSPEHRRAALRAAELKLNAELLRQRSTRRRDRWRASGPGDESGRCWCGCPKEAHDSADGLCLTCHCQRYAPQALHSVQGRL